MACFKAGAFTCVGWQVMLCDLIWQVMLPMNQHCQLFANVLGSSFFGVTVYMYRDLYISSEFVRKIGSVTS